MKSGRINHVKVPLWVTDEINAFPAGPSGLVR